MPQPLETFSVSVTAMLMLKFVTCQLGSLSLTNIKEPASSRLEEWRCGGGVPQFAPLELGHGVLIKLGAREREASLCSEGTDRALL